MAAAPTPALRPVTVEATPEVETPARTTIVLVTPQGCRVEGLDGDTLVAVLQALACR